MVRYLFASSLLLLMVPLPAFAGLAQSPRHISGDGAAGTVSDRQIHAYASALLEIEKVRQSVSFRAEKLPQDQAALLKSRAQAEMIRILGRHDLDAETFNRISARVDEQRRLRREVKQLMMEERLAI
ncbi:hypothetical protein EBBID32_40870 [Sphingobium indicum BiD32]|uniref:DUF4168 domain-containing protein n=2 Tax=Sphingobium indicum TaxID=332055 RepID=N1MVY9_9SPHN|nr:hypothetical protein EBBID32_40870 [Sphingobium indicum BiD32]